MTTHAVAAVSLYFCVLQSMIQLSRTQDEEVGDGTTSVIILAGELLQVGGCCLAVAAGS
jgi:chaperonin GroEL (HSP60 family)